jgi:hypothetical protein
LIIIKLIDLDVHPDKQEQQICTQKNNQTTTTVADFYYNFNYGKIPFYQIVFIISNFF